MTSTDDYESLTVNNYKSVYKMGLPEDKSSLSLPHDKSQAVSQSVSMDDYESIPSDKLSHIMMAGATAGIMEHCVMFPFDTIKVCSLSTLLGLVIYFERWIFFFFFERFTC